MAPATGHHPAPQSGPRASPRTFRPLLVAGRAAFAIPAGRVLVFHLPLGGVRRRPAGMAVGAEAVGTHRLPQGQGLLRRLLVGSNGVAEDASPVLLFRHRPVPGLPIPGPVGIGQPDLLVAEVTLGWRLFAVVAVHAGFHLGPVGAGGQALEVPQPAFSLITLYPRMGHVPVTVEAGGFPRFYVPPVRDDQVPRGGNYPAYGMALLANLGPYRAFESQGLVIGTGDMFIYLGQPLDFCPSMTGGTCHLVMRGTGPRFIVGPHFVATGT